MKKKKGFLVVLSLCVIAAVGTAGIAGLHFFSGSSGGGLENGELDVDYFVVDEEKAEKTEKEESSRNLFQWIADRLASDKESADTSEREPLKDKKSRSDMSTTPSASEEEDTDLETGAKKDKAPPKTQNKVPSQNHEEGTEAEQKPDGSDTDPGRDDPSKDEGTKKPEGDTVTIVIRCDTAVKKGMDKEAKWAGIVPSSGEILPVTTMTIKPGETVFSVLTRASQEYMFQMEYSGSAGGEYIEGINNLYEFDGGRWSGWMYCVNDWYPNYGCGQYALKNGDVIQWNYTCDLGKDLGQEWIGEDWTETHE